jgi:dihydrofolate reductase
MKAIVAMGPDRVIGCRGSLPWHFSEDLHFFKNITDGGKLIMGRKTYESIGKPLPNRVTYILTNNPKMTWTSTGMNSAYISGKQLEEWVKDHPANMKDAWLCGGAAIYKQFLPFCTEIYVTHIADAYEGDTYMPDFESLFPNPSIVLETKEFIVARYTKMSMGH